MRRMLILAVAATISSQSIPAPAEAGMIDRACLTSGRKAANRALCKCIQFVADQSLTRSDQRLAATFFRDPHKAQEIRQSDQGSHEEFWQRYKSFGAKAEAFCRGY